MSTDSSGEVFSYREEPSKQHYGRWETSSCTNMEWVGTVDLEGLDWRETLVEI
jgi:hypothetical protein